MADQNRNAFHPLLQFIQEVLDIGVSALKDTTDRASILVALGFDPSKIPDTSKIPQVDDLKPLVEKLLTSFNPAPVIEAVTKVSTVIAGFVSFFSSASGPDGDKTLKLFLNIIVLRYIEKKEREAGIDPPVFRDLINMLKGLVSSGAASRDALAPSAAGSELDYNFVEEIIGKFFDKLSKGKTEDAAALITDLPFVLLTALLRKVDKTLTGTNGPISFESKLADLVSGDIQKKVFELKLEDKSGPGPNIITATFGGESSNSIPIFLDFNLSQAVDKSHAFDANKRLTLKAKADVNGKFEIGKNPELNTGKFARANFLHRRDDAQLWTILESPAFKFVPGTYQLDVQFKNDNVEFRVRFDLKYQYGRGNLSGFPFDFLPENETGKQTIELGWSLQRSFFGGGSSIGAGEAIAELEGLMSRDSAAPSAGPAADILKQLLNLITMTIPLHKNIGGILGLETLYLAGNVNDDLSKIGLEASLDFWLKFGSPITISVSRLGVLLNLEKNPSGGGVLGYDIVPAIKPPNGAGVRVNASVITGGGFLYIDEPKGEYFGALQLSFKGLFDLKAVGIINTIMPDGKKGFSMFILITAEFSAIQLGFGFTLLGVGGMLGINRGMDVEPIRVGLRTGAIRSILFPEDVVGNIQRIISDIKQIFPIKEGGFVIGLMAKIGWGTPTLISAELGVMVELPDPKIVILGIIKCILPSEDAPLLKLQINFLGVIDFQNEFIYFEARLFDSSVVGITLTGSMAFVVAWGKNSTFGISVGGFHPDFKDYPTVPTLPGAFRDMDRIGLQLLSGDNPRLGVEAYFAITSNSVQFGAKAELYAGGPFGFNLYGMLAFDALFIFEPFSFIISLEATLAIRHNTSILFGLHFKGRLAGPRPWNVAGEVSFSVFPFVTITIGFDVTWGDPALPPSSATKDLVEVLRNEIRTSSNWKVELPDYHNLHVSLREFNEVEQTLIIVHPFGQMVFSQRALPLDYDIQKFGEFKPLNISRFSTTKVTAGNDPDPTKNFTLPTSDVKELFAAGNYTKLSESEKLSRKSFESFNSGERLKDEGKVKSAVTPLLPTEVNYELDYTGDDAPVALTKADKLTTMQVEGFNHLRRNAAASKSAVSWAQLPGLSLNSPEPIQITEQQYFVVRESDLSAVLQNAQPLGAATQSEAIQIMRAWEALNPDDAGELQVLELHELV